MRITDCFLFVVATIFTILFAVFIMLPGRIFGAIFTAIKEEGQKQKISKFKKTKKIDEDTK